MKQYIAIVGLVIFASLGLPSESVGQWVQANGPYGGSVSSIAAIGSNLFAAIGGGSLFLSTDNGAHWKSIETPIRHQLETGGLFVNGTTLFLSHYRSLDSGKSWVEMSDTTLHFVYPTCWGVHGTSLFMGDGSYSFVHNAGVLRSTDNGEHWTRSDSGLANTEVHAFASTDSTLFAVTSGGLFSSRDDGTTWKLADTSLSHLSINTLATIGHNLFVSTYVYSTRQGDVLRSTDNGASWTSVVSGLIDSGVGSFAVIGGDLFAANAHGIFRTSNDGETWIQLISYLPQYSGGVKLCASDSDLWVGTSDGILLTKDRGFRWDNITSKLIGRASSSLVSTPDGSRLYASMNYANRLIGGAYSEIVYVSTDSGNSWTEDHSGLDAPPFKIIQNGTQLVAATRNGLYSSSDAGMRWTEALGSGMRFDQSAKAFIALGSRLFVANDSGVYRSTDNGMSWEPINNGLSDPDGFAGGFADSTRIVSFAVIDSIGFDPILFASTPNPGVGVYRSTDYGTTWSHNSILPSNAEYSPVQAMGHNLLIAVSGSGAADSDGIYLSTDLTNSWNRVDNGLPAAGIDQLIEYGAGVLGRADGNIFRSNDNGVSWTAVDTGSNIGMFTVSGSTVVAGRDQPGIWRRPLSDFGIKARVNELSQSSAQVYIYPNPMRESTTISLTPYKPGHAEISILNLLGKEVASIFSGEVDQMEHRFSWRNAMKLPDGIYTCVIRINSYVTLHPVALLR